MSHSWMGVRSVFKVLAQHMHGRNDIKQSNPPPPPDFKSFRAYVVGRQNQYIKPSALISTYDANDVFELLNFHDRSSCTTILSKYGGKVPPKKLTNGTSAQAEEHDGFKVD